LKPKYIVLDRDGVINVDLFDYVLDTKDFKFEEGSFEALVELGKNNFEIVVATNQKCINLGLISSEGIKAINDYWVNIVAKEGVKIKSVEVCPHKDEEDCDCRKPKTGLLKNAEKKHGISLKDCYFVGDKLSDIECALTHGCKPILVETGYGTKSIAERGSRENLIIVKNLREAVKKIIRES
jgi:D-glycero-D-manno-heptose 1,7-bisphosphate phosphatase